MRAAYLDPLSALDVAIPGRAAVRACDARTSAVAAAASDHPQSSDAGNQYQQLVHDDLTCALTSCNSRTSPHATISRKSWLNQDAADARDPTEAK